MIIALLFCLGFDYQPIGNNEWLMRKKYWGKPEVKLPENLFF